MVLPSLFFFTFIYSGKGLFYILADYFFTFLPVPPVLLVPVAGEEGTQTTAHHNRLGKQVRGMTGL